jgi:hypothetical protein
MNLQTPVAFFIFRRPETTARVFEVIRKARPRRLLIVADGPRNDDERARCEAARAIVEQVDWDCEVLRNYSDSNLGLRKRMSSGLDWVFEQCAEAIILEDDCLPDITFFRFCQELLEKYRDEPRVMHISGDCFAPDASQHVSYAFLRFPHVWGWATWSRAWRHYDVDLRDWQTDSGKTAFLERFSTRAQRAYWKNVLQSIVDGKINTWDFQWSFACIRQNGLSICPALNLVTNIGFGSDATNTVDDTVHLSNLEMKSISFPLRHPAEIAVDAAVDAASIRQFFTHPSYIRRHYWRLRSVVKDIISAS